MPADMYNYYLACFTIPDVHTFNANASGQRLGGRCGQSYSSGDGNHQAQDNWFQETS